MRSLSVLILAFTLLLNGAIAKGRSSYSTRTTSRSTTARSRTMTSRSVARKPSDQRVNGYTRRNGTRVQPYMRSAPNGTQRDNFSTKGNTNPYTGKKGTKKATH